MVRFKNVDATAPEVHQVLETLQRHCLPHDDPTFPKNGVWWIGYDGQPVAFCCIKPSRWWSDTAYLARAGVLGAWRGNGLQKRMIRLREQWARRNNYRWLITDTSENPPSGNSLISCGYRLYTPRNPWALETSVYWRKKL